MDLDMVLAVDLDPSLLQNVNFNSAVDILFRAEDIEGDMLKNYQINLADFVLTPNVGHIHWSDFLCFPETIRLGQDELFENLDKILSLSKRRNFPIRRLIRPRPKLPAQWTDWIEI